MPSFLFCRPNTGLSVQGWIADDPDERDDYEAVTCLACQKVHIVSPKTGKVVGEDGNDKLTLRTKSVRGRGYALMRESPSDVAIKSEISGGMEGLTCFVAPFGPGRPSKKNGMGTCRNSDIC